jgi:cyclophilin family peptidyl-prolyl cis-trans isomerase/HEAT repeat protein
MKSNLTSFATISLMLVSALFISQCSKPANYNKFQDPELQVLAEFADRRNTDSVLQFLSSKQPLLRAEAAYALASIRDPRAVNSLHSAILDPIAEVRTASAYALGQILHPSSIEPLSLQIRYEGNAAAFIALAEAIGKIGGGLHSSQTAPEFVENAANALFNLERADSIGIHAIAKGTFWMHNGGWGENRLMNKIAALYPSQSVINRRMIAFAMGRYRGPWYTDTLQVNRFLTSLGQETDTLSIIAALPVAGRTASALASRFISKQLSVSCNNSELLVGACRASGKNEDVLANEIVPLLSHNHLSVVHEACAALTNKKLGVEEINRIKQFKSSLPASAQAAIARMLHSQGDSLDLTSWISYIDQNIETYERLACIRALGVTGKSAETCFNQALSNPDVLQANAYTEAFIETHSQKDYRFEGTYANALLALMDRGDIGISALCATELRNVTLSEEQKKQCNDALNKHLSNLSLPKEVETANEIIKTINAIGKTSREEIKVEYNNPIDWNLVKSIPCRQLAQIYTSKGVIEIELHVEEAPGSVASFVKLCRDNFYNGKSFHRVVPNFVIQGGCPRGDGMGSTDYTLRSEFRLHDYRTGSVGLASSGPDTESCQWFITHIPTPHLEGRYTIFAHVTAGMEVVDQVQIGDTIQRIILLEQ